MKRNLSLVALSLSLLFVATSVLAVGTDSSPFSQATNVFTDWISGSLLLAVGFAVMVGGAAAVAMGGIANGVKFGFALVMVVAVSYGGGFLTDLGAAGASIDHLAHTEPAAWTIVGQLGLW